MVALARAFGVVAGVAAGMRLLDDIHSRALSADRAVTLFERYLQLRLREQRRPPSVATALGELVKIGAPQPYDAERNIALVEATERYIAERGEWPTEEQRRAFLFDGVDFTEEQ